MGEINETDNSVRALYEARKIESKLAQRKMLGIANPNLVSVDEIRNRSTRSKTDCNKCGCSHGKRDCPAFGKECHNCGRKNHFSKMCRSSKGSNNFQTESKCDSRKPRQATGKCTHKCRVHEINECQNEMEDLSEQVQSLFYS